MADPDLLRRERRKDQRPPRLRLLGKVLFDLFLAPVSTFIAFHIPVEGGRLDDKATSHRQSGSRLSMSHEATSPGPRGLPISPQNRRNQDPGCSTRGWQPSEGRFCYRLQFLTRGHLLAAGPTEMRIFGVIGSTDPSPFFALVYSAPRPVSLKV